MVLNRWTIVVFIISLVLLTTECRRRGGKHGGPGGHMWGGPPRRIPPWWAQWFAGGWEDDDDGLPPGWDPDDWDRHDSHEKEDWDPPSPTPQPLGAPVTPGSAASTQSCSYTDRSGIRINCELGCCISARGFGCCLSEDDDGNSVQDHTQMIIYITLGVVGALLVGLAIAVAAWRLCKTNTSAARTPNRKPAVKPRLRPITPVAPVLPAEYDKKQVQPTPVMPTYSRVRLPSVSRNTNTTRTNRTRPDPRPTTNGNSRYDIFTVGTPTPVLPSYTDFTESTRPPPAYSVNEPSFGSGYLRSISSPPPPYSPNDRPPSQYGPAHNGFSRYTNI